MTLKASNASCKNIASFKLQHKVYDFVKIGHISLSEDFAVWIFSENVIFGVIIFLSFYCTVLYNLVIPRRHRTGLGIMTDKKK